MKERVRTVAVSQCVTRKAVLTHRNICNDWNNFISGDGWTPLHLAAMFGKVDVIQILLDAGADPYARDHNEKDVVDIARQFNHFQIADMLQRYQTFTQTAIKFER